MTPAIRAALALREHLARGGSIAPGLPGHPFAPIPTPSVTTPGLASPHGLISAHHRQHFAAGGTIPPSILAALALRPHFEDGGDAGGGDGDSSRSGGSNSSGGDGDGDGHGSNGESSSSSSSGSAGGVGGFGGNAGNDGYGGSSSSSSSSGGYGGVGGSGGGSGYGGSNSSSSSGGQSEGAGSGGYGGSSNSSSSSNSDSASSGGFSSGAASGADSMGGSGGDVGGASATSGSVGSIGGSYGAPAAGGFSSEGAPATGGFGSFGATPSATSNDAGLTGASLGASSLSGQTASQSAAAEAAHSEGDAGEDGTAGLGGVPSTGQAFSSFGLGPASPYGAMPTSMQSYSAPNPNAGLMSSFGSDGSITPGSDLAKAATPFGSGLGAYGLSTDHMMGFDNFGADGSVQQSSLGAVGFTGSLNNPATPDADADPVSTAIMGNLRGPDGYVGGDLGLGTPSTVAAVTSAAGEPGLPGYDKPFAPDTSRYDHVMTTGMPVSALNGSAAGTTPGTNADGDPMSVAGTSALTIHGPAVEAATGGYDVPAGMQNDQDVTNYANAQMAKSIAAKYGMNLSDAAAAGFVGNAMREGPASLPGGVVGLNPGAIGVGDVAPGVNSVGINQDNRARAAGMFSSMLSGMNGAAEDPGNFSTAQTATSVSDLADVTAAKAALNAIPGALPSEMGYSFAEISTLPGFKSVKNALTDPNATPAQIAAAMQTFEGSRDITGDTARNLANAQGVQASIGAVGGSLPGANPSVAPSTPSTPSFANFSPGAASGMDGADPSSITSRPGISPPSDYSPGTPAAPTTQTVSTPSAYSGTADEVSAMNGFGYEATPTNAYALHALGPDAAYAAVSLPSDTPIGEAGIPGAVQQANPSLFAGVQTVGDLRANIAAAAATAGPPTSTTVTTPGTPSVPTGVPGYSYSPGAASGLDSIDPAATTLGISAPPSDAAPPAAGTVAPTTPAATAPPATTTPSVPDHLAVNPKVANIATNLGLGLFGGPIGAGVAAVNGISGLLGGPTIGDGINGILGSSSGAASVRTGASGGNSGQPDTSAYSTMPAAYGPSGSSSDVAPTTPAGVNPLDPHATAMAAYQAALAGQGKAASPTSTTGHRPLTIHRRAVASPPTAQLYNPMQDPSVLHALGLSG